MIFDGKDIRVVAAPEEDRALLVVTFTGRDHSPPAKNGAGSGFLTKNRISAVHVISKANHWWQTPEFDAALAAVRRYAEDQDYREVVTYGSSMGGYGALVSGRALAAVRSIAMVPQYSIDPAIVPWEDRWLKDARRITFLDRDFGELIGAGENFILYDPLYAPDAHHVALIAKHAPIRRVALPFARHDVSRLLAEVGLLSEVTLEALRGTFDSDGLRARMRTRRRETALTWSGAAQLMVDRGNDKRAMQFSKTAFDLMLGSRIGAIKGEHERLVATHIETLLRRGKAQAALLALTRWAAVKPESWPEWRLRALAHAQLGDGEAALALMLSAVRSRAPDRALLGELTELAIRFASAEEAEALAAEFRKPLLASQQSARRGIKLLRRKGLSDAAAAFKRDALARFGTLDEAEATTAETG